MNDKTQKNLTYLSVVSIILVLLLGGLPILAAPPAQGGGIVIDGVKEAAWGDPLASDPVGDMSEPNLDLQGLHVVEDAHNYYIGFDATASNWGMAYGIYIDSDQVDGSGALSDPWGRAVNATSAHWPEHMLYVWHEDGDALQDVQLNHWDGAGWSYDSLISQGGEQGYGPADDWIEYRVPKAALGIPASIALELFTTGGGGHAQDSVPSDPNVAYGEPDWGPDVTTLSAFALFPPPAWYAKGDFNGWGLADPMYDDGSHGDATAGDGIYTALVTVAAPGRYEFKVATDDWSVSYPGSGNSWLDADASEVVAITFDTNIYADGWLPTTNIIGVSTEPGTWTAVGNWQGWDNANPATAMTPLGDGEQYQLTTAIASPGTYEYKAVKTGTWDAVGADGRSVNAGTVVFGTVEPGQEATFTVDAFAGRVRVEIEPVAPRPKPDDNIWWDGLGHNSRDDLYRVPGGAVTTGTPVILRLRAFHDDVTAVTARVWSTAAGAQALYPMALVASTDDPPYGYDYWQATIPAQDEPTILYYRFIVRDGSDEDFYEDDDLFDGGWGTTYNDSPDYSFQIDVYQPNFTTPDWIKNAVVYQIFPDRFYNGDPKNDAEPTDPTVYDNPVLVKSWDDLPEGYCRGYEGVTCDEGPQGRDFFGGDLQGVKEKLDYLVDLGVTAIYFNPIFKAPSNHLYDTTDYFRIDPYFGSMGTFQSLIDQARERGIRVILDGVFNHTSSDSIYFDRYSRYPNEGAYESQDSRFYDWYTFSDWPDDYNSWWGFDSLPVLTEVQEVRDLIYGPDRSVARWWVEHGAAGWRLDVAPDKSHEWWQEFRPRVKAVSSEAVIVGEIWDDASPWLLGDEFDSTMNYRFRRALLGFVNGDMSDPNQGFVRGLNPDQLDSVLQSIKEDYAPPAFEATMNLVGSHDTQRILWALTPGGRNREDKEFDATNLAEGKAKLKLLAIIQMTLPGAPTIYYGDEVGLTGDTDPDDRRPIPWDGMDTELLAHYRTLIGLRNAHSFLRTGSFDRLYTHTDHGTYAYVRKNACGAAVVAVNRDTAAHELTIPLGGVIPEGTVLTDALNDDTYTVSGGQVTLSVAGRWGAILVTQPGTDLTPPDAPTGLTATAGDATVGLAWSGVPGTAGYYVYRSPVSGGGYARLNDTPLAGTSYADGTVANGRLYYYAITAVDGAGNESGRSNEAEALPHLVIGWANLQWPPSIVHTISALDPTENIYGQVWIYGHTNLPGATEGLVAQVGHGPDGSHPDGNPGWIWVEATFNVDLGNNDEFMSQLLPEATGSYDYAYRYSTTAGRTWVYADLNGTGDGYDPAQAGDLTVDPSGDTTPPAAPTNLRLVEASPSFVSLAWDPVADADLFRYEVYRGDTMGGPYAKVANVLALAAGYSDWDVATGATHYYVVLAADTSFNRSSHSNEVEATAQARPVQVTFKATLPTTTPDGEAIYIGGSFNGWDPAGTLMTRVGLLATATLSFYEGDRLEYKYTRGSWTYVEKGASCEEIANRAVTVVYGADGTMTLDDTVLNWRNTAPCGN
ncbi:MAG: alpha-amylase [Anaerolineae bacterium]|nr:MAG: alpha-amylase [Anaerolineae bacterium]